MTGKGDARNDANPIAVQLLLWSRREAETSEPGKYGRSL